MRYRPTSIKQEGLNKYLDRTAEEHNGFGYAEFLKLLNSKVNNTNLARAFKVQRATVIKWLKLYDNDQKKTAKKAADEAAVDDLSNV